MSENMEQAVDDLIEEAWRHGTWQDLQPRTKREVSEHRAAVLSLYATALRERDSARALAVQAGKALAVMVRSYGPVANGTVAAIEINAALDALKAAGIEMSDAQPAPAPVQYPPESEWTVTP